jgi:hypothetical protein
LLFVGLCLRLGGETGRTAQDRHHGREAALRILDVLDDHRQAALAHDPADRARRPRIAPAHRGALRELAAAGFGAPTGPDCVGFRGVAPAMVAISSRQRTIGPLTIRWPALDSTLM